MISLRMRQEILERKTFLNQRVQKLMDFSDPNLFQYLFIIQFYGIHSLKIPVKHLINILKVM